MHSQFGAKKRSSKIMLLANIFSFGSRRVLWGGLCLLALALACPISVLADTVSGRVYGQDGKPVSNATFTAKPGKGDAVEFKTDSSGNFSVYLDPGRYTVTPAGDSSSQAVIDSLPQPAKQDVHLKKGGS